MKKLFIVLFFTTFFLSENSFAQLTIPALSPKASIMQTAGLTDITIDYSSPAVKGRVIWGDLLPYDSLWRAGANSATKIAFSKDVTIQDVKVPKGSYSIFVIPSKSDWTIILNKDIEASTDEYSTKEDIVRIKTKTQTIPHREHLAYTIPDFSDDFAIIALEWEKIRVSFTVKLATNEQAMASINATLTPSWRSYANSANYLLNKKADLDQALKWIDQSITLKDDWYNNWIKAKIFHEKGMNKEAYAIAQKTKELGDKVEGFFFKSDVEKALGEWKKN